MSPTPRCLPPRPGQSLSTPCTIILPLPVRRELAMIWPLSQHGVRAQPGCREGQRPRGTHMGGAYSTSRLARRPRMAFFPGHSKPHSSSVEDIQALLFQLRVSHLSTPGHGSHAGSEFLRDAPAAPLGSHYPDCQGDTDKTARHGTTLFVVAAGPLPRTSF